MYYHVVLETSDKDNKGNYERCYELDCVELDDIKQLIIKPYLDGRSVYIDGRYLAREDIKSLKIKSSEKTLDELCRIAQSKLSPGIFFIYKKTDIVRGDKYVYDLTKEVLRSVGEILDLDSTVVEKSAVNNRKVFIVHGRDNLAKIEAARFVEKLGLTAIILHEQASEGKTIIEKIETYADVGFAIVLYTPCDVGGIAGESCSQLRARQNVVFEHGYMVGKLGRERVCALLKNGVEIPNDISGVVYIELDSNSAWQFALAKELRKSGYDIDMNKIV